ncbi:MAG TPA: MFS transporter [Nakamurella sp.]|nr:MFS transporter [Nakamurella sp.]
MTTPRERAASGAVGARPRGGALVVVAVVLLAINLRPAVNALGAVMPELRGDTGLSGTTSGVLLALPTLCFALMGLGAPALAARIGSHRTVVLALASLTGGQVLRALVGGTPALFAGSVLALAGIAVGNVLLPGLVRLHFPGAITGMTAVYTTMLTIGGTLGAGVTLPIEHAVAGSWRTGIGMWAVTAGVALLPWVAMAVRHTPPGTGAASRRIGVLSLLRSRKGWAMAGFFGSQSLQAYVMFGWLASILADAGLPDESAAGAVALVVAVGIPISAMVPALLGRLRRQGALIVGFVGCYLVGYLWLILFPTTATWMLALLIGLGGGAFPMSLTLMALRSRTHSGTVALSAFGQSVGYLLASIGPVGFGFLHDISGGWTVPLVALMAVLAVLLCCGLVVVRGWVIEDHLRG